MIIPLGELGRSDYLGRETKAYRGSPGPSAQQISGCGENGLSHAVWDREGAGSNPVIPTRDDIKMIKYRKEIFPHKYRFHGYIRFYDKDHPLADCSGIVLLHRHMASIKIGRWLTKNDVVHHINGNREDNRPENLDVTTVSNHSKIHARIFGHKPTVVIKCICCGNEVSGRPNRKFCSVECCNKHHRMFDIEKNSLMKLVWMLPTTKIADMFGVSDKAINKRCKLLGISKPGRGYWSKQQH